MAPTRSLIILLSLLAVAIPAEAQQSLPGVKVQVAAPSLPEGFLRRRKLGTGHFIDQAEIDARRPSVLTDLLRTVPGVRVLPGIPSLVRFRGSQCAPLVWLDGAPLGAGEFDIDGISPSSIAAIELYAGIPPLEFLRSTGPVTSACGVIVLWSRTGQSSPF